MQDEIIRLTRAQVREIDRIAIEEYHIPGIVLMENAARGVADVALKMLETSPSRHVTILCGTGNNGGDGYAVARMLHQEGVHVVVVSLGDTTKSSKEVRINVGRVMVLPIERVDASVEYILRHKTDLWIDAIFGTGIAKPPRAFVAEILSALLQRREPILAVDLPSGLDCDSGEALGACIRAKNTVTFVAEKAGFANPKSRDYTGEIIVVDIGAPVELTQRVRQKINPAD